MQAYSDPSRASDPHSLPDVEVWEDVIVEVVSGCGVFEVAADNHDANKACPSCERESCVREVNGTGKTGWFWWTCFPGCMPDSDAHGPYASEDEALDAAQDGGE